MKLTVILTLMIVGMKWGAMSNDDEFITSENTSILLSEVRRLPGTNAHLKK